MHTLGQRRMTNSYPQTSQDGYGHQYQILNQQVADGQMDIHIRAYMLCHQVHDERTRKQGDDTAKGCQRYREGYVATCQHGKDIAGTATRTTGYQHDAQKKQRCNMKYAANSQRY